MNLQNHPAPFIPAHVPSAEVGSLSSTSLFNLTKCRLLREILPWGVSNTYDFGRPAAFNTLLSTLNDFT